MHAITRFGAWRARNPAPPAGHSTACAASVRRQRPDALARHPAGTVCSGSAKLCRAIIYDTQRSRDFLWHLAASGTQLQWLRWLWRLLQQQLIPSLLQQRRHVQQLRPGVTVALELLRRQGEGRRGRGNEHGSCVDAIPPTHRRHPVAAAVAACTHLQHHRGLAVQRLQSRVVPAPAVHQHGVGGLRRQPFSVPRQQKVACSTRSQQGFSEAEEICGLGFSMDDNSETTQESWRVGKSKLRLAAPPPAPHPPVSHTCGRGGRVLVGKQRRRVLQELAVRRRRPGSSHVAREASGGADACGLWMLLLRRRKLRRRQQRHDVAASVLDRLTRLAGPDLQVKHAGKRAGSARARRGSRGGQSLAGRRSREPSSPPTNHSPTAFPPPSPSQQTSGTAGGSGCAGDGARRLSSRR